MVHMPRSLIRATAAGMLTLTQATVGAAQTTCPTRAQEPDHVGRIEVDGKAYIEALTSVATEPAQRFSMMQVAEMKGQAAILRFLQDKPDGRVSGEMSGVTSSKCYVESEGVARSRVRMPAP